MLFDLGTQASHQLPQHFGVSPAGAPDVADEILCREDVPGIQHQIFQQTAFQGGQCLRESILKGDFTNPGIEIQTIDG